MLDDVTVPDEQTGIIEQGLDSGDLARIGDDRVLKTRLPNLRRPRNSFEWLAIDNLKLHLMDVDGVGIFREVVAFPKSRLRSRLDSP